MLQSETRWDQLKLDDALCRLDQFASELSVDALICISRKCRKSGDPEKGRLFLELIRKHGFETQNSLGNHVVPMLVECGSITIAQDVFDKLKHRNVHAWTSLISGYVHCGLFHHARNIYVRMRKSCVSVNSYTLVALLKASLNSIEVQEMHLEIAEHGLENDIFVGSTLIDSYVKFGALPEAHCVFSQMSARNVVSWTALIGGYVDNGFAQEAVNCYEKMQQQLVPNDITILSILKAYAILRDLIQGQIIHTEIVQKGFINPLLDSTIIDMYAKCGSLLEAESMLKTSSVQDVVAWNALLAGYVDHGLGHKALACFDQMLEIEVPIDVFTVVCALRASGDTGASGKGFYLHKEIVVRSFEGDSFINNTLIDMYGKCGSLIEAQKIFDGLEVKDLVAWNVMLSAYCSNHEESMALELFECMQAHGVRPDSVTFTSVLSACKEANYAQTGLRLFKLMLLEYAIPPTADHFTCLIDLLARSGLLHEAEKLLDTIKWPQSKEMWLALLSACNRCSELDLGLRCFEEFIKLDPECSTPYILVANMYSKIGRWQDAHTIQELGKTKSLKCHDAV
ncbi:hypothetical protein KP509_29G039600 [Ceratopteris richardii]|uniref:Pentatricopeptide repeat-containing protein n=1 Tax=Ceratopteris richardii TaxID=49495 RepID=A0A8T2R6B5_CERRI|nr:hypothetical protein KP509_29G039600 [Ceratopteris richardii]